MNPKFLQQLRSFLYFQSSSDTSQVQLPVLPLSSLYPSHFSLFPAFFPDLIQAYINSLHLQGILQPQRVFIEMVSFDLHKRSFIPLQQGQGRMTLNFIFNRCCLSANCLPLVATEGEMQIVFISTNF